MLNSNGNKRAKEEFISRPGQGPAPTKPYFATVGAGPCPRLLSKMSKDIHLKNIFPYFAAIYV